MTRGKPLYLSEERYAALTYLVNVLSLNSLNHKDKFLVCIAISCFTFVKILVRLVRMDSITVPKFSAKRQLEPS